MFIPCGFVFTEATAVWWWALWIQRADAEFTSCGYCQLSDLATHAGAHHVFITHLVSCFTARGMCVNSMCLVQDTERLSLASHNLQTFWTHLEVQRQQLERERDATKERRGKRGKPQPILCQRFFSLQIDLRDLMKQVNSQVQVHTC